MLDEVSVESFSDRDGADYAVQFTRERSDGCRMHSCIDLSETDAERLLASLRFEVGGADDE